MHYHDTLNVEKYIIEVTKEQLIQCIITQKNHVSFQKYTNAKGM